MRWYSYPPARRLDDLQSPAKSLLYPLTYLAVVAPVRPNLLHPRQLIAYLLNPELRTISLGLLPWLSQSRSMNCIHAAPEGASCAGHRNLGGGS
jgi:hypothetical protein